MARIGAGWGAIFSLQYFLKFMLRLFTDFEPPMYAGNDQKVCVVVGGKHILVWSKPGLWPLTGTGTNPNN